MWRSAFAYGQPNGVAGEFDFLAAFGHAGGEAVAERLGADVFLVLAEGFEKHFVLRVVGDLNAVGQLEVKLLAHLLDVADEVAAQPLSFEFGRDRNVQRHRQAPVLGEGEWSGAGLLASFCLRVQRHVPLESH